MKFLTLGCGMLMLASCTHITTQTDAKNANNLLQKDEALDNSFAFIVKDQDDIPVSGYQYAIFLEDGVIYSGITNANGETMRVRTATPMKLCMFLDEENYYESEDKDIEKAETFESCMAKSD